MSRDRYGIKFTRSTAKRLLDVGRHVEQAHRNQAQDPSPPVLIPGLIVLLVTVACNKRVGTTPGANGRGKIQQYNGTTYSDLSTTAYPIINDFDKQANVGAYVQCLPGPGGKFHMINTGSCSDLS